MPISPDNIYKGFLGETKVPITESVPSDNIYGSFLAVTERESLEERLARLAEDHKRYEEAYESTKGLSGIARAIKDVPRAAVDVVTSPIQVAKGATAGLTRALTLGYVDPSELLRISEEDKIASAARTGFDIAGTIVPYTKAARAIRGGMALTRKGRGLLASPRLVSRVASGAATYGGAGSLVGFLQKPKDGKDFFDMTERVKTGAIYGGAGFVFGGVSPMLKPLFGKAVGMFKNFKGARDKTVEIAVRKGSPAVFEPIPVKPTPVSPGEFPTRFRPIAEIASKSKTFKSFEEQIYRQFSPTEQLKIFDTLPRGVNLRDVFNSVKGIRSPINTTDFIPTTKKELGKIFMLKKEKNISDLQFNMLKRQFLTDGTLQNIDAREARNFISILRGTVLDAGGRPSFSKSTALVTKELTETEVKKMGILNYFLTPRLAFKRLGLEKETAPIFNAFTNMRVFVASKKADITTWRKELGITKTGQLLSRGRTKEQSRRLFHAINNPEKNVPLTDSERLVVTRARLLLKELADMVDDANRAMGLSPMKRRDNYITNLITDMARTAVKDTKGVPPTHLLSILQRKLPTKAVNKLLYERKGNLPIKEDFWESLDVALNLHSRYSFISPAINRSQKMLNFLRPKIDASTWKYMTDSLGRFVGRPSNTEVFLRNTDDMIQKFITKTPLMSRKITLDFHNSATEVLKVPLWTPQTPVLGRLFPSKIFGSMKMLKYWSDLSFSIPYYTLNLTQFWQNVPPKLRGTPVDIYLSAGKGYAKMMNDFFRPSRWQYWRRKGVLSEMDSFLDREIGGNQGFIAKAMNAFSRGSEFNNRVASVYAVDANLKRLAAKGNLEKLWPELNKAFGKDYTALGKHISDITQFRFGVETKPAAFANPVTDLYHQYNTFALNQGELVWGMASKLKARGLLTGLNKAIKEKKTGAFLADLTMGERGEIIRYVANASGLIYALNAMGGSFFRAIGRSVEPTFVSGLGDFGKGLMEGDPRLMQDGLLRAIVPPAFQGLVLRGEADQFQPAKNLFKNLELAGQLLDGEEQITIYTRDGIRVERILDRNEAVKEFFFGTGRVPQFEERGRIYDAIREIRKDADLKREDEWHLAREIVGKHIVRNDPDQITQKLVAEYEAGNLTESVLDKVITLVEEEVLGITSVDRAIGAISGNENKAVFLMKMRDEYDEAEFEELLINLYYKDRISDDVLDKFLEMLAEDLMQ